MGPQFLTPWAVSETFECPYDLAAGSPQSERSKKERREEATTLFMSTVDWMFVRPRKSQVEI